ncbi:MAG: flavin reductase family protein [Bacteroidia bacterium]|nr:flavin reductase family protein [Bacteroidia bacterium]MDW8348027.1 flavin reductase family protein [Bacteroidia bacterium]
MSREIPNYAVPLGKIVSGCYIICLKDNEKENAFLASLLIQVGFYPPMVGLAVAKDRYALTLIRSNNPFTINIIGKEQNFLFKHFGKGFGPDEYPYNGIEIITDKTHAPVLSDCIGYLEVKYKGEYEAGDHIMVFAEVLQGEMLQAEGVPYVHIRKNGLNY